MGKRFREENEGEAPPPAENVPAPTARLPALPWMRSPLDVDSFPTLPLQQVAGLDHRLVAALCKSGVQTLFPVQVAVWQQTVGPGGGERDLCICSPTGSGKTLSYALPIVQLLSTCVIKRLRALVVLPTRDLAIQVKEVFDIIAPSVGLSVGLAIGQTQVAAEAAELVKLPRKCVHSFSKCEAELLDMVESRVDVLVATPGRLMDHISNTEGFTLEHLTYLVIDETDRLLRQAYQDWLPNTLDKIYSRDRYKDMDLGLECGFRKSNPHRVMKMVLSATLTRDPAKISQIKLHFPIFISANIEDKRYHLPEQLQSYRLVCDAALKPLHLIALLELLKDQKTIVFTASVFSTHRLYLLLSCFENLPFKAVEYSSLQHQHMRSNALAEFKKGDAEVLVASDAMTRGMDVEGVMNVINYDVPVYAKTYVHRVGRTARAGRSGSSYTLLRKEEVRHFKEILQKADNSKCKKFNIRAKAIDDLYPSYVKGLEKLKEVTASEAPNISHSSTGKSFKNSKGSDVFEI